MQEPTTATLSVEEVRSSLRDLLGDRIREALKELLELELDATIGALRHERTEARGGYRNGHSRREVVTEVGPVELAVPRARLGDGKGGVREPRLEIDSFAF